MLKTVKIKWENQKRLVLEQVGLSRSNQVAVVEATIKITKLKILAHWVQRETIEAVSF